MTTEDTSAFHRHVAEELVARYAANEQAPQEWRETLAWHWEQAGAYAEAAGETLEIAEVRMTHLDFASARRWAERTLTMIERLDSAQRRIYDLRAYALALAVLEFGGQYREGSITPAGCSASRRCAATMRPPRGPTWRSGACSAS